MASPAASIHDPLIEPIRAASRGLVREWGFMKDTLAGTPYSPVMVHTLIEIGKGNATTIDELSNVLNTDVESVRSVTHSLIEAGEIERFPMMTAEEKFIPTSKGLRSIKSIDGVARAQLTAALSRLSSEVVDAIKGSLENLATMLNASRTGSLTSIAPKIEVIRGYKPGIVGRTIEMHMNYYSRFGFGTVFESFLAEGIGSLIARIEQEKNEVWTARFQDRIIGTIFVDGEGLGSNKAHIRAFIVDSGIRGGGVGRRLLAEAIKFIDEQEFAETHLWTFKGLDAARHLYESVGFTLKEQFTRDLWGKEMISQEFIRKGSSSSSA